LSEPRFQSADIARFGGASPPSSRKVRLWENAVWGQREQLPIAHRGIHGERTSELNCNSDEVSLTREPVQYCASRLVLRNEVDHASSRTGAVERAEHRQVGNDP
jgi:hypothetical protein